MREYLLGMADQVSSCSNEITIAIVFPEFSWAYYLSKTRVSQT